jgi:hypothetical protein
VNSKALCGFQNGQPLVLAKGYGLRFLLCGETAALSCHGDLSWLGRRLSDLSIEPGQPQGLLLFADIREIGTCQPLNTSLTVFTKVRWLFAEINNNAFARHCFLIQHFQISRIVDVYLLYGKYRCQAFPISYTLLISRFDEVVESQL